jgi:hypothetical protein
MRESFDLNIDRLAATVNAFDGLTVIGGGAGHPDPQTALFGGISHGGRHD